MIQITQLKLPIDHSPEALEAKIRKTLHLSPLKKFTYRIVKRSIDARKKPEIFYSYAVNVETDGEAKILKKYGSPAIQAATEEVYRRPERGFHTLDKPPIVIGAGPAGLFCAYLLTEFGFAPVVLERGKTVEKRTEDVHKFWETGVLDPDSNVQFGEGGAGTFSDGKLNTAIKDKECRNRLVLETFVRFGAPERILYDGKPHIGTDKLTEVIANMRNYLTEHGCTFHFETCVTDFLWDNDKIRGVKCGSQTYFSDAVVLAPGHSARDVFRKLYQDKISMSCKEFAVGMRIEHPQEMIDKAMYGVTGKLEPAPYKLTANFPNEKRGVYSFCMCPGGYVVNASSMTEATAVNGMSYYARDGKNANSAIIVSVGPADFGAEDALAGMRYQEALERDAFRRGAGGIPQQLLGDYQVAKPSSSYGAYCSSVKGKTTFTNLRGMFPLGIEKTFLQGMQEFSRHIPGFDRDDAILSGVESRTSSPVRILRDEAFESTKKGLYPCGEGAGYAGGIMSAAMDGIKVAEAIIRKYHPAY